jgi:hypothetical protein
MATTGIDCPVCGTGRAPNLNGKCHPCAVQATVEWAAQPQTRPVKEVKQKSKLKKTKRNTSTPRLL